MGEFIHSEAGPWKAGALPDPLDAENEPALDQYCDLVLKGGIIDGVVYPGILLELARSFRFQSIAGTSVGALAASLAAASEFSRRFNSNVGFDEVLRKMPDELQKKKAGKSKLESLFQTSPDQTRLFDVLVDSLAEAREKMWRKLLVNIRNAYAFNLVLGFLIGFGFPFLVFAISYAFFGANGSCLPVAFAVCSLPTLSLAVLLGLVVALLALLWAIYKDTKRLASSNGFGFCTGMSENGGQTDGLTEWLHKGIQGAAGLPLSRPLTFEDLWKAPGGPPQQEGSDSSRSIDLRVISTALSHGRPYEFPQAPGSSRLFFRLDELVPYFPASIINHLERVSKRYSQQEFYLNSDLTVSKTPTSPGLDAVPNHPPLYKVFDSPDASQSPRELLGTDLFRELPAGELPILVAARLSMNFPILLKSIPLWAVDREAGRAISDDKRKGPKFKRTWFSDGGITSNFPIHTFDKPIPSWPTFGIYIAPAARSNQERQKPRAQKPAIGWLPRFHTSGESEKWIEIDAEADLTKLPNAHISKPRQFVNFLSAIFDSAKDWSDNANLRMPGIRDRVAFIYKNDPAIGGLNLKLGSQSILDFGYINGPMVARSLVTKFLEDTDRNVCLNGTRGWMDHRWVRLNSYLQALKKNLAGFTTATNGNAGTSSTVDQITDAKKTAPLKFDKFFESALTEPQAKALQVAVAAITQLESTLAADKVVQPYAPSPAPQLASRPQL